MVKTIQREEIMNGIKQLSLALCDLYGVNVLKFEVNANRKKDAVTIELRDVISL
jgi:hypothetical protein